MRQRLLHAVDGLDDVGAGLAEDDDQHRRLAVGQAEIAHVLDGIVHRGEVRQLHRGAVAVGHDQRRVIGGLGGLVVGIDLIALVAVVDRALRAVGVCRGECRAHVFEPDAVFEQRLRIELDAHCRQCRAADDDLADARDLRQPLLEHVAGGVVHLALAERLGGHRQDQDRRIGRVDLAVGRIAFQVRRQVGTRGDDGGLDVARGAVDVAVELELQRDARLADAALRGHLGDAGDLAEMAFQRAGDAGRHRLRARAGQLRADRDGREIDLRQRRHRQFQERQRAGECDAQRQQRRRHRPGDEWRGNIHASGPPRSRRRAWPRPVKRSARRSK